MLRGVAEREDEIEVGSKGRQCINIKTVKSGKS